METSQNENVILIDDENEIYLNDWNMENEIMNENFQTNLSRRNNRNKWRRNYSNKPWKIACSKKNMETS